MARSATSAQIAREVFVSSLIGSRRRTGPGVVRFARRMQDVTLAAGETLYRRGDSSHYFFFVVAGQMKLSRPGAADSIFGEREILGTLDVTLRRSQSHDAVATMPSRLLRLRVEDWAELLEDDFQVAERAIARSAAEVYALRSRPAPLGGFEDPPPAKASVAPHLLVLDRIFRLRSVAAFSRASTQALAILAELGSTRFADTGQVMFAAGEAKGQLVVIASGEVELAWQGAVTRFGAGSLVGGNGAVAGRLTDEIRATVAARAIVIPLEDYFDVMEEHFDLVRSTLIALSEEREMLLDRGG